MQVNVAVAVLFEVIETLHVPVPEQPLPLHPVNTDPNAGVAVKLTGVYTIYVAEHVEPQFIPPISEVTVPLPVPVFAIFKVYSILANEALTVLLLSIVKLHVPVPLQSPVNPEKLEVASGVAVIVTFVPDKNWKEQVAPQLIPAGLELTIPPPAPDLVIVRV